MKRLLIRDDDANRFTTVDQLAGVYDFLFERNIPINFSVIPMIDTSATTNSDLFGRGSYEPFIPREVQGINANHDISQNKDLCHFLSQTPCFELLMHGYSHASNGNEFEFYSDDSNEIEKKINAGLNVFNSAFGMRPQTFVAPQDQYSCEALRCIAKHFRTFSTGWIDRTKIAPIDYCRYLFTKKIFSGNIHNFGSMRIIEHPGCCFSKFVKAEDGIARLRKYIDKYDTIVIVVHHWEFYEGNEINKDLHQAFKDFILDIFHNNAYRFMKFSELD